MIRVVAAIIERHDQLLITQRRPDQRLGGLWEFPGGKVEKGESDQAALRREIQEEVGLEVEIGRCIHMVKVPFTKKNLKLFFYKARVRSGVAQAIEVADLRWVRRDELSQFNFPPADDRLIRQLQRYRPRPVHDGEKG